MDKKNYDFSGWATKHGIRCSDGRTIMKGAFADCDGTTVPLVWNHKHSEVDSVLGHALLENRDEGVYAYCSFNDTENGKDAKELVRHGDIGSLSIYANHLKESAGKAVVHGIIREVSLVLAGANPGAYIDSVIVHADGGSEEDNEQGIIYTTSEDASLICHMDGEEEQEQEQEQEEEAEEPMTVEELLASIEGMPEDEAIEVLRKAVADYQSRKNLQHGDDEAPNTAEDDAFEAIINYLSEHDKGGEVQHADTEEEGEEADDEGETIQDVFNTLSEKQKNAVYIMLAAATDGGSEEDSSMKHNVFDSETNTEKFLSHADQEQIISMAKTSNIGSLRNALSIYMDSDELNHTDLGINDISQLFPDYKDVNGFTPELLTDDQGWITHVLSKVHKSPISRIRTRQADVRDISELRAKGYTKQLEKTYRGNISLIYRTTDPQTIYVKSKLDRDDIIDIVDFDVVQYMYNIDKMNLNEEIATAIMLGDGRAEGADGKISEEHIRPIWLDDELYTIHADVDFETMADTLQGTDTEKHFGENYIYAEAVVQTLLYTREQYKGSSNPDLFMTPHLLNVMLLARDLNGRRIYTSVADLKAALNVGNIITAEQFDNKTREVTKGGVTKTKKLLALMCNLSDYHVGSTKGGQITHFTDFDIDFNQEKSLLETRISGANVRVKSAIALEEDVTSEDDDT